MRSIGCLLFSLLSDLSYLVTRRRIRALYFKRMQQNVEKEAETKWNPRVQSIRTLYSSTYTVTNQTSWFTGLLLSKEHVDVALSKILDEITWQRVSLTFLRWSNTSMLLLRFVKGEIRFRGTKSSSVTLSRLKWRVHASLDSTHNTFYLNISGPLVKRSRESAFTIFGRVRHRGPSWQGDFNAPTLFMGEITLGGEGRPVFQLRKGRGFIACTQTPYNDTWPTLLLLHRSNRFQPVDFCHLSNFSKEKILDAEQRRGMGPLTTGCLLGIYMSFKLEGWCGILSIENHFGEYFFVRPIVFR